MVDFAKKIKNKEKKILTNPIEIYEALDRQTEKVGSLRPAQIRVLNEWFKKRLNDHDVILKLNTGAGKTLVGLLMLETKLHLKSYNDEPNYGIEIFLCNNRNLVFQTMRQAKQFGINVDTITPDNEIPIEVINGEKILVTSVQRFFNGKSIFEHSNELEIDTIVIDDAHRSAELIKQSCEIKITKKNNAQLYTDLFNLLSDGLESQGEGTFAELKNNSGGYDSSYLPVPYWTWIDKIKEITSLIADKIDTSELRFVWPIVKDHLEECDCIIAGSSIEIKSLKFPIEFYTKYVHAKQRVFMSATTASDSILISDLGINDKAVKEPLIDPNEKWSGEKMVIIPSLISDKYSRQQMVKNFGKAKIKKFGVTVLVPGYYKTGDWEKYGAVIGTTDKLQESLKKFDDGEFSSPLVLVNRYDGMDLADDKTRILILDSLPTTESLFDKYISDVIPNGAEVILRTAQKIEQGMGRSVRADTDYSIVIFIGSDLVRFVRNPRFQQYFSGQTLAQIKIGISTSNDAKSEYKESEKIDYNPLFDLMKQSINRNEDWKEYYKEQMERVDYSETLPKDLDFLVKKNKIMEMIVDPIVKIEKLTQRLQDFIDNYCSLSEEKGFYLQLLARATYNYSKSQSTKYQTAAYKKNHSLLLPNSINPVEKINPLIAVKRIDNIINQVKSYKNFENFMNAANEIFSSLSFGTKSKTFEMAIDELGKILGFETDRPDEFYKKGPDHLWAVKENLYYLIEDKSEDSESRDKINKAETGQMNNSVAWFKQNYPGSKYIPIMVIPTKYPDPAGGFNDDVRIMRKKSLNLLKNNFINFVKEFRTLDFSSLSNGQVLNFISVHQLEVDKFIMTYSEPYYK